MSWGTRVAVFIVVAGTFATAGCSPAVPSATPPPASASPVASASVASPPSTTAASPPAAAAVVVDAALLDVLPAEIDGRALIRDTETAAEIVAGGGLPAEVDVLAVGVYVGAGSSTSDDLAIANVVRLRPGVFSDGWFRSWRDTYNVGACEVAGGVSAGSTDAEIDGRPVYIGTCQAGVHLYHVHLPDPDRVISITSLGDARYGERVVAGLTE